MKVNAFYVLLYFDVGGSHIRSHGVHGFMRVLRGGWLRCWLYCWLRCWRSCLDRLALNHHCAILRTAPKHAAYQVVIGFRVSIGQVL